MVKIYKGGNSSQLYKAANSKIRQRLKFKLKLNINIYIIIYINGSLHRHSCMVIVTNTHNYLPLNVVILGTNKKRP